MFIWLVPSSWESALSNFTEAALSGTQHEDAVPAPRVPAGERMGQWMSWSSVGIGMPCEADERTCSGWEGHVRMSSSSERGFLYGTLGLLHSAITALPPSYVIYTEGKRMVSQF